MPEKNNSVIIESTEIEDYKLRIKNFYDHYSESEKKIANYFLQNNIENYGLTIYELAAITGISSATIVRFCRTLGFKGYAEFKFYLKHGIMNSIKGNIQVKPDDSASHVIQKVASFNKQAIDDTLIILDNSEVERAIEAISKARNCEIYSEGGSSGVAVSAANAFGNIGIKCSAHADAYFQMMSATYLGKQDVAISICHRGDIKNSIDAMAVAKAQGAVTICVVGYPDSPLARFCDIVLCTSARASVSINDIPTIRICEMLIINILQIGVLTRNFNRLQGMAKKVRQITDKKRITFK